MAGERKGKAFEAVVLFALDGLRAENLFSGELFWEKKPTSMSIKPDITIGADKDTLSHYLLITHSGSAKESEKKMWRNLGELVEAKTLLDPCPRVFGLTFGSIKEDLEPIQTWAFDEFRWERGQPWHLLLDAFVSEMIGTKLAAKKFCDYVRERCPEDVLAPLRELLRGLFSASPRIQMDGLWALHRSRTAPLGPSPRNTHIRRGLAKLLIFEDLGLGARLHDVGEAVRVERSLIPEYAYTLGLADKSLTEGWGVDSDIRSAISCLGRETAVALAAKSLKPRMEEWYFTLRNAEVIPHQVSYIEKEIHNIKDPVWLWDRFVELHDDPFALVPKVEAGVSWPPPTVWLFELVMQIIRAGTGSGNGYGYAQLSVDVIERFGGQLKGGGQPRLFRIVLPDWIHRRGNEIIDPSDGIEICTVLARRFSEISGPAMADILSDLAGSNASHILEQKIIPYRMFDPLGKLLHDSLKGFEESSIDVCFRQAAELGGQAGRMVIGKVQRTLVNWQSAHGSHTNDKKKELCGRAVGIRYQWSRGEFQVRSGIDKLILLLDGTWCAEDIRALLSSGWDDVFYGDEIDKLVGAIV